jgi:hypothetical protein
MAAEGDGTQRSLAEVVVNRQIPLLQVTHQGFPVVQGIAHRLTQHRLRQYFPLLLLQPWFPLGQHRTGLLLPPQLPLLFPLPPLLGNL